MKPLLRSIVCLSSLAGAAALAVLLGACATGGTGSSDGPTVAVAVNTVPNNVRLYVDDSRAGESPARVNLLVAEDGTLAYDVDITADFSSIRASQALGVGKPIWVRLKKGEIPPATILFDTTRGTPSGQALTLNPAGTRASAPGRVGDRDMIVARSLTSAAEEEDLSAASSASSAAGAGFGGGGGGRAGGGGAGLGGGGGGRGN